MFLSGMASYDMEYSSNICHALPVAEERDKRVHLRPLLDVAAQVEIESIVRVTRFVPDAFNVGSIGSTCTGLPRWAGSGCSCHRTR
jgi:hypothetical protein